MRKFGITLLILLTLTSCVSLSDKEQKSLSYYGIISGTVMYPNNLYFPARVRLEIALISIDSLTAEEKIVVSQSIRNPQRFPVNFILRYDSLDIRSSNLHFITIELYQEGEILPYLFTDKIFLDRLSGDDSIVAELKTF
jgi:uncharacterized lipoprotein YbaY